MVLSQPLPTWRNQAAQRLKIVFLRGRTLLNLKTPAKVAELVDPASAGQASAAGQAAQRLKIVFLRGRTLLNLKTLAKVAELVDAHDSKSCSFGSVGSIPTFGTSLFVGPL